MNTRTRMKILNMVKNKIISKEEGAMLLKDIKNASRPLDTPYEAVVLRRPGTEQDIDVQPMIDQDPGSSEVQILVKAFPLNFSDFLLIKGLYPMMPDYPFTPGVEVSGVIRKIGKDVTRVKVGDEVIGVMRPECGGQASLVVTHEDLVIHKPPNVTHEEVCGFPAAFLSTYIAFEKAEVTANDTIYIPTATGTNGLVAVQLAQYIGADIYASAGFQHKLDFLQQLGVKHLINYQQENVEETILQMTNQRGVDVVINTIAGESMQTGLNILASEGRYVELAVFGLQSSNKLDLSNLVNNQSLFSFNVKKFMSFHPERRRHYLDIMAACLEQGIVKPNIAQVFPFSNIKEAYQARRERATIGRVIVNFPHAETINTQRMPEEKLTFPTIKKPLFGIDHLNVTHDPEQTEENSSHNRTDDIAIIGVSGRFADAENVDHFWENLKNSKNSIVDIPIERWDNEPHFDPDHQKWDKTSNNWGGFMQHVDLFDSLFFNISGHEAKQMDPQQRVFLEESWRALEDAGYATEKISNQRCGVYVGVAKGDYVAKMQELGMPTGAQSFWGNESSILAARISYHLNLKGPAIAIDTACSSSLVAVHMACQSLLSGECELALAGGVFIYTTPEFIKVASSGGMLSPEGQCKTFDNHADGFVPGEAAGTIVLKRLREAERDGDQIYGIIKGSHINQDGKTNGITAPSSTSQTEVEQAVYDEFGIHPESIQYIEAHGTGTKLGDPIEIAALTNTFRKYTKKVQFCGIGSVKTNIGHTAAASGVTNIIKLLMAFKHQQLPSSLNFNTPNEHIDFKKSPFFVNDTLRDWDVTGDQPRRAATSSFGFSGTNAHMVLEEYPGRHLSKTQESPFYVIPLSAKTDTALQHKMKDLAYWLETDGKDARLEDLSYTLAVRRSHFSERTAWVVKSTEELINYLGDDETVITEQETDVELNINNEQLIDYELMIKKLNETTSPSQIKTYLNQLAHVFKQGSDVNWGKLFQHNRYHVLSLPTYPFEGIRYWIDEDNNLSDRQTNEENSLHPLVTRNTSTLSVHRYTTDLQPDGFYFTDHVINDEKIFPGVCFIEMSRAAGELAGGEKISLVQDICWIRPLTINVDPKEVHINLYPLEEGIEFQAYTEEENDMIIHCEGILFSEEPDREETNETINLQDIKASCEEILHKEEIYERFEQLGLQYVNHFRPLETIYVNLDDSEALSHIVLPSHIESNNEDFFMHPTLLDGALQTVIGFIDGESLGDNSLFLPLEIGEIEQLHPLPSRIYVHMILTDEEDDRKYFDIDLYDEHGNLIAILIDFTIQAVQSTSRRLVVSGEE